MEKPKEAVSREESDASSEDETNHCSASSGFKEKGNVILYILIIKTTVFHLGLTRKV